ncbi:MAG: hypothetical protein COT14_04075 [Candidatus Diapherotrites archaeon CG08_land_8_20_14_0_20_30_16]|nr:MAG: hypothetical protein COT14_04075 [Candidatus Diapherotrites archaeon CG08_land_8_20_14_0_20_30_16]
MQNPNKDLEIELIPWVHTFRSNNHAKILAYLERVPKGSVLFVEIPEVSLDATQNLFRRIQSELRFNAIDGAYWELYKSYLNYMRESLLTYLGIYTVAEKRGIRLVPIDTSVRKDGKEFLHNKRNQNFIFCSIPFINNGSVIKYFSLDFSTNP